MDPSAESEERCRLMIDVSTPVCSNKAFAWGDRRLVEGSFIDDLVFSSPVDVKLDRAGYFERCWPGSGRGQTFEFVRLIESGDELVVTYEMTKPDGSRVGTPRC